MKVAVFHYRIGGTDGVSLEIEKRRQVLEELGHDVVLIGGSGSNRADHVVSGLSFDSAEIRAIRRNSFESLADYSDGRELVRHIYAVAEKLRESVSDVLAGEKPDLVMLHNIFSHGRHIAAARAFSELLSVLELPALAMHHDFYWEREEYLTATCDEIERYLSRFVPPVLPRLEHAVISSLAEKELRLRKGVHCVVIPDTLDFDGPPWGVDKYNADFLSACGVRPGDVVLLQATRIVERKGVEIALDLAALLRKSPYSNRMRNRTLYNGKRTASDSRVVLMLAGYAEADSASYREGLRKRAAQMGVEACFAGSLIRAERGLVGGRKLYSLWDAYAHADAVTYPSLHEGWGNQLIEAVFARKPIVLFEYPVYRADIKPAGFRVISLGSSAVCDNTTGFYTVPESRLRRAAEELVDALTDPCTAEHVRANWLIGRRMYSIRRLKSIMAGVLDCAGRGIA